jgi:hypothetical protein
VASHVLLQPPSIAVRVVIHQDGHTLQKKIELLGRRIVLLVEELLSVSHLESNLLKGTAVAGELRLATLS